jgi:anhydro-N-acetylmuramic acid kinase
VVRGIGLMSGTSLDGVDAACVYVLETAGEPLRLKTRRAVTVPFEASLHERLLKALPPNEPDQREVAELDVAIGEAFAAAAQAVAGDGVDFIASHGLTLFHDGPARLSVQIGNPYVVRDRLRASVIYDFRRADCALGGQGAPLVPYVDALLFGGGPLVGLNIGGIANVSVIGRGAGGVAGWDTGPGNILIDAFVRMKTGGAHEYDAAGAYALRGTVDAARLAKMLHDEYFSRKPPKSTGREHFGARYLANNDLFSLSLEDGCATLTELTAQTIAAAVNECGTASRRVIVSGGGVDNPAILRALRSALPDSAIARSDEFGIDAQFKEAIAFAVLGFETLRGRPSSLPAVTGATEPALLGSIAPYELEALLAKVRA